jgi:hypothetical protein
MKPNLAHLRVFGCDAYNLTPKRLREDKLEENSKKCIMIRYGEMTIYYCL